MKKFILIVAMMFTGIFSAVCAGEIKFVQVADPHMIVKNQYSVDVLKSTVDDINKLNGISFVVFTGDNIDSSNIENHEAFLKIINKLKVPYYVIIGNHDVFKSGGLSKQEYISAIKRHNWFYRPSKPNYVFKRGEFVFIVVDGAKERMPGTGGYYRPATLDWLDKQLTKYKRRKVVILQHFPVLPPKDVKTHRVYQVENYYSVLNRHDNVIAIISGHYHINKEKMENGIYHISSPCVLTPPNPYKIIDIVTTKGFSPMIYTQIREVDYH